MECYVSRRKTIGPVLICGAFMGACYFCLRTASPKGKIDCTAGLAILGLGLLLSIRELFRVGAQVVLSDRGIDDRRTTIGPVAWEDVRSVRMVGVASSPFLCLELIDPAKYLIRLSWLARRSANANRALGFGDLCIGFEGLTPGIKEAFELVRIKLAGEGGART